MSQFGADSALSDSHWGQVCVGEATPVALMSHGTHGTSEQI